MPPSMMNKVDGLCGHYDGKIKNDLMTKQGITETNAIVFANQWKVDVNGKQTCKDVSDTIVNPCNDEPKRKMSAEKLCGHLRNKTFEGIDIFITY